MTDAMQGRRVAMLIAPSGTSGPEFVRPHDALRRAGADVTVISLTAGFARTVDGDAGTGHAYTVHGTVARAGADDFDALVIPGGALGTDRLRAERRAVAFAKAFLERGKPVAAIGHGVGLLMEADVVRGRRLTSAPALGAGIADAGGERTNDAVVVDDDLVTGRGPGDLDAFCAALVGTFRAKFAEADESLDETIGETTDGTMDTALDETVDETVDETMEGATGEPRRHDAETAGA